MGHGIGQPLATTSVDCGCNALVRLLSSRAESGHNRGYCGGSTIVSRFADARAAYGFRDVEGGAPEADPTSMTAFTADASVELERAELRHRRSSVDTVIQTKSRIGMP